MINIIQRKVVTFYLSLSPRRPVERHNIFLKFTGTFLGEIGDQNMAT